jgi:formate--tetrahydrofolate ligase
MAYGVDLIYPICGDMRTMPGLSASPAATRIDIDSRGEIVGLS